VSCNAISEHKKASFAQTKTDMVTMTVRLEQRNSNGTKLNFMKNF